MMSLDPSNYPVHFSGEPIFQDYRLKHKTNKKWNSSGTTPRKLRSFLQQHCESQPSQPLSTSSWKKSDIRFRTSSSLPPTQRTSKNDENFASKSNFGSQTPNSSKIRFSAKWYFKHRNTRGVLCVFAPGTPSCHQQLDWDGNPKPVTQAS